MACPLQAKRGTPLVLVMTRATAGPATRNDMCGVESSEERSLGEEEDMDLFIAKPKPRLKKMSAPAKTALDIGVASDDDGGFDVSELMNAVPPIADADEDFDDI
ncbi:hypothetical protein ANCDUO_02285 [Ancylostoma duodenale]|uniref:Uncharacterized protein n=1 Tax=Ancylostoma duodenale TaxID=51022 RepID=A0A0C2H0X7_9BILA|nr:hypothetical protein ANCDUO_02285 [Ancylostoma duodenale]